MKHSNEAWWIANSGANRNNTGNQFKNGQQKAEQAAHGSKNGPKKIKGGAARGR